MSPQISPYDSATNLHIHIFQPFSCPAPVRVLSTVLLVRHQPMHPQGWSLGIIPFWQMASDIKQHTAFWGCSYRGLYIYMFIIYTYIPLCVIICQLLGIIIYPYSQARSSKIFIPLLKLNTYHPPPFRPRLKAVLNLAGWQYVSDFNDYFYGNHQHSAPFVEKPPTK